MYDTQKLHFHFYFLICKVHCNFFGPFSRERNASHTLGNAVIRLDMKITGSHQFNQIGIQKIWNMEKYPGSRHDPVRCYL
jgi:hypothetical protein